MKYERNPLLAKFDHYALVDELLARNEAATVMVSNGDKYKIKHNGRIEDQAQLFVMAITLKPVLLVGLQAGLSATLGIKNEN